MDLVQLETNTSPVLPNDKKNYLIDIDGNNARRLTNSDGDELFPVWRPIPEEETQDR